MAFQGLVRQLRGEHLAPAQSAVSAWYEFLRDDSGRFIQLYVVSAAVRHSRNLHPPVKPEVEKSSGTAATPSTPSARTAVTPSALSWKANCPKLPSKAWRKKIAAKTPT